MAPLPPLAMSMVTRKEWKRKNRMFNLPLDVQSSTDKKLTTSETARRWWTPMKSNIVSIGCCVWLLPTRLPANRNFLLKLYMLVKSAWTVSREFYLESYVSTLGLPHMVSWGCCDNTLLCKACLHAGYHQPVAQNVKTLYFVLLGKWQLKNGINKPCVHWMDCACLVY